MIFDLEWSHLTNSEWYYAQNDDVLSQLTYNNVIVLYCTKLDDLKVDDTREIFYVLDNVDNDTTSDAQTKTCKNCVGRMGHIRVAEMASDIAFCTYILSHFPTALYWEIK